MKSSASFGAVGGGDMAGWSAGCFRRIACTGRKKYIMGGLLLSQGQKAYTGPISAVRMNSGAAILS